MNLLFSGDSLSTGMVIGKEVFADDCSSNNDDDDEEEEPFNACFLNLTFTF